MKRDMDLIRELMLLLEERPAPAVGIEWLSPKALQLAGRRAEEIGYHLSLLEQAGFIEAGGADALGMRLGNGIAFRGLSWTGHDFIDSVRPLDVWEKTKAAAARVGGYTVDILVAAAKAYAQQKITELIHSPH